MLLAARNVPDSQIRALDNLQHNTGLYVLAGSAANAVSYESTVYGQGLLTYALLKCMKGAALRRDGADEFIDVEKLLGYAVREVPQLAKGIGGIQEPFYRGGAAQHEASRSFDVGRVTEAVRQQIRIAEPKPVLLVKGYQDEATFDDQLGIKAALEAHLSDLSARGAESPIAFMQDANYPDAYVLAGRYTTTGNQVTVIVNCSVTVESRCSSRLPVNVPNSPNWRSRLSPRPARRLPVELVAEPTPPHQPVVAVFEPQHPVGQGIVIYDCPP